MVPSGWLFTAFMNVLSCAFLLLGGFSQGLLPAPPARARAQRRHPPPVLVQSSRIESALRNAQADHDAEVVKQAAQWAVPAVPTATFRDEDFRSHSVGASHMAGPDAASLAGASVVHTTRTPILSTDECAALRSEAAAAMARGATSDFTYTAKHRLGEVHVGELPVAREWLRRKLSHCLYPMLASRFAVAPDDLVLYDGLVVQYDASRNATRQPVHRDGSLLTINVALSDPGDFVGGGTYFEASREVISVPCGHAVCHASGVCRAAVEAFPSSPLLTVGSKPRSTQVRHAGNAISQGERWVLVLFVLARSVPQLARRCAERAAAAKARVLAAKRAGKQLDEGAFYELEASLSAALTVAPDDHELLYASAGLHVMRGETTAARAALQGAVASYPHCPKPRIAMGSLLIEESRLRGALRHFEAALRCSVDDDDDDSWEAAVNAALCIVRLHALHGRAPLPASAAVEWLQGAAAAAPDNAQVLALLHEAQSLAASADAATDVQQLASGGHLADGLDDSPQTRHTQRPAASQARTGRIGMSARMTALDDAEQWDPYEAPSWFRFEVLHESRRSRARVGCIHTPHGVIDTPGFVPVGTNGALKAMSSEQAAECGVQLMFCNTYHLLVHPGPEVVEAAGGLHTFMHRSSPLITDSGGFQVRQAGSERVPDMWLSSPSRPNREPLSGVECCLVGPLGGVCRSFSLASLTLTLTLTLTLACAGLLTRVGDGG